MDSISAVLPGLASNTGIPDDLPGGEYINEALSKFGIDSSFLVKIGVGVTIAASLFGFVSNAWAGLASAFRFFSDHVVSSATLKSTDETYVYLMKYFYTHRISTDSRLFGVTSRKNTNNPNYQIHLSWYDRTFGSREDEKDMDGTERNEDNLGPTLKYTPAPGFYYFFFQGKLVILQRTLGEDYYGFETPDETVTLFTIGRSPKALRTLLETAREEYLAAEKKDKTLIHTTLATYPPTWSVGQPKRARGLDTVVMKEEDKISLLKDMREYIKPSTMRWYRKRGIPWRRGYLFHGPPGTGKTSLTMALAQELNLKLYILSLGTSTLADDGLITLFNQLPKRCIVLIEDVDSAGINRESIYAAGGLSMQKQEEEDSDIEEDEKANANQKKKKKKVQVTNAALTLSGLLNSIDGIASHEGRILIMTTNHRDMLDDALIRPGRCDRQVEFGRADREILTHIFRNIYYDDETDEDEEEKEYRDDVSVDSVALEKRDAKKARIEAMAEEFAAKVPHDKFTPAEIQGLLLRYKFDPQEALDNIEPWIEERLEEIRDFKELEKRLEAKEERARQKKIKEFKKKKREEHIRELKEAEEMEKEEAELKEKEEKKKKEAEEKTKGKGWFGTKLGKGDKKDEKEEEKEKESDSSNEKESNDEKKEKKEKKEDIVY